MMSWLYEDSPFISPSHSPSVCWGITSSFSPPPFGGEGAVEPIYQNDGGQPAGDVRPTQRRGPPHLVIVNVSNKEFYVSRTPATADGINKADAISQAVSVLKTKQTTQTKSQPIGCTPTAAAVGVAKSVKRRRQRIGGSQQRDTEGGENVVKIRKVFAPRILSRFNPRHWASRDSTTVSRAISRANTTTMTAGYRREVVQQARFSQIAVIKTADMAFASSLLNAPESRENS